MRKLIGCTVKLSCPFTMSTYDAEITELKKNVKKRTEQQKKRSNLRRLQDTDDPTKVLDRIEQDVKDLQKHMQILRKVLARKNIRR